MRSRIGSAQSGFSLVELMVAMVVTLMVSGAIFGLLTGGQTAFRREPELTDRQQNIRSAMDMIMRDISNAGAGFPTFVQPFTQNLDACVGCPPGPDGDVTDELEILTYPGLIESEPVCYSPGVAAVGEFRLARGTNAFSPQTTVIVVMENGTWTVRNIVDIPSPPPTIPGGNCNSANHLQLSFSQVGDKSGLNPGGPDPAAALCQASLTPPGFTTGFGTASAGCTPIHITFGEVVRYRIRNDAFGVPVLQRFTTGDAAAGFQPVVNGVEELQVKYRQQNNPAALLDGAPPVLNGDFTSLITEVQVTLSARSEAANLQGQTSAAVGVRDAVRGRLVSSGSPRTALIELNRAPAPLWR